MNISDHLPQKLCPSCQFPFTPINAQHVYCDDRCLRRAAGRRRRARAKRTDTDVRGLTKYSAEYREVTFDHFLVILATQNTGGVMPPIKILKRPYGPDFVWPPGSVKMEDSDGSVVIFPGDNSLHAQASRPGGAPSNLPGVATDEEVQENKRRVLARLAAQEQGLPPVDPAVVKYEQQQAAARAVIAATPTKTFDIMTPAEQAAFLAEEERRIDAAFGEDVPGIATGDV